LAEALDERGVESSFVGSYSTGAMGLLDRAGMTHRSCAKLHADEQPNLGDARGVIVDSYDVTPGFLERVSRTAKVVCIDDAADLDHFPCAGVLNFTVRAPALRYPTSGTTAYFLGPEYTLARRSLRRLPRRARATGPITRVLVALGGVDRDALTVAALEALGDVSEALEVRVAIRTDDPHRAAVERAAKRFRTAHLEEATDGLADAFAWCDVAIVAGGLTKYEAGMLRIPTVALPRTALESDDVTRCVELGFLLRADADQLREPIRQLLSDVALRARLHEACGRVFGGDPTARAASRVLETFAA
jgi:spore coat polysaccharide biosynthesis predicted glycosyltransferase SpsG